MSRLFGRGGSPAGSSAPDGGVYVYLRCNGTARRPCGEPLRVRINPLDDLLEEYEGEEERISGYVAHKDVLGAWCQTMTHLTINYDADKREIGRQAEGATLIDAAEYERLQAARLNKGGG
ncbi:MAG: hypothetical protein ACHQ7M_11675 [Chloroflexota bacterium]